MLLSVLPNTASVAAEREIFPKQPIRWLAAGDSYSAGEGLTDVSEPTCQRATRTDGHESAAWAVIARDHLQDPKNPTNRGGQLRIQTNADGRRGFDFVACTGAVTEDLFDDKNGKKQWDPNHNGSFHLVTFNFGGNNIRFKEALEQCVGWDALKTSGAFAAPLTLVAAATAWTTRARCPSRDELRQRVTALGEEGNLVIARGKPRALRGYKEFLRSVAKDVVEEGGNVVVAGYPMMFEDPNMWTGTAQATDVCQGVRREDADMLRGVASFLNQTIGNAVELVNKEKPNGVHFSFVDLNTGNNKVDFGNPNLFEPNRGYRHNLCAAKSSEQWLNGITTGASHEFQWRPERSFHPIQTGHDHIGALIAEHIRTLDWTKLQSGEKSIVTGGMPDDCREHDVSHYTLAQGGDPLYEDFVLIPRRSSDGVSSGQAHTEVAEDATILLADAGNLRKVTKRELAAFIDSTPIEEGWDLFILCGSPRGWRWVEQVSART